MKNNLDGMKNHPVVPHDEWLFARKALLAKEKELTRLRDELSRQRRALPWEKVDKQYVFEGPDGQQTLADLFEQQSQYSLHGFICFRLEHHIQDHAACTLAGDEGVHELVTLA